MGIKVDSEFRDRVPTGDADADLREMLQRDGCRDALTVWKEKGILVDGHRRYRICEELGIGYRVKELPFDSRADVLDWIDRTALTHRILTAEQTSLIRGRVYNATKKSRGGDKQTIKNTEEHSEKAKGQNVLLVGANASAKVMAEEHGVDEKTIRRDGEFAAAVDAVKAVDPEIEKKLATGEAPPKKSIVAAAKAGSKKKAKEILQGQKPTPEKKADEPEATDEIGEILPEGKGLRDAFRAREQFDEVLNHLTQLTKLISPLIGDPGEKKRPIPGGEFLSIGRQQILADIKNIRAAVKHARPYCVCPYPHKQGEDCRACKGLGWSTESVYSSAPKNDRKRKMAGAA